MDKLLTLQEVAARFQVDVRTVRRWLTEGYISGCRPGGRIIRIDANSLDHLYVDVHYKNRFGTQKETQLDATATDWQEVLKREKDFITKLRSPRKLKNSGVSNNA